MDIMKIGKYLQELRKEKNLTQNALAVYCRSDWYTGIHYN